MQFSLLGLLVLSCIYISESVLYQNAESIAVVLQQLQAQINELNATHARDVAELRAAHALEVGDLKAGLNAETLARCRTGSIYFDHAVCASHQCSQNKTAVFSPPFTKVPVVTFAFSELDISGTHNLRITAWVTDVTNYSALLHVSTWADTVVYSSNLNWIACPNI